MAEHTPTPWICNSEGILPISRDGVSVVARVPNHPENQKNWDADAAFIVKAVNCHEMLVRTLEGIAEFSSGDDATLGALSRLASIRNTALTILAHVNAPVGGEKL